jgi:hypothetical protein
VGRFRAAPPIAAEALVGIGLAAPIPAGILVGKRIFEGAGVRIMSDLIIGVPTLLSPAGAIAAANERLILTPEGFVETGVSFMSDLITGVPTLLSPVGAIAAANERLILTPEGLCGIFLLSNVIFLFSSFYCILICICT